ncbi:hypothetical protein EGW08_001055, partial [Elysia chlorotica]
SSHLGDSLRIASRLNQQTKVRQKRFSLPKVAANTEVESPLSSKGLISRKRRNTDPWDDLEQNYGIFHSDLTDFVNDLPSHFKPGSPPALQYIALIPDIMPVDDPDFIYKNEESVVDRVINILRFTGRLLQGAKQYVANSSIAWYDEEEQMLTLWAALVKLSLTNLKLSDGTYPDTVSMDSGFGGLNPSYSGYKEVNLDHIAELLTVI